MKKRMFITLVCAVLMLGLVGGVTSVLAKGKPQPEPEPQPQIHIQADLPMPASLHVFSTADGCSNNTGPWITIDGEMTLGGIGTKLIFRNNAKGTHEADAYTESELVIIPQGGMIKMPKQPVLGGVGGNPWIYMQFYDSAGYEISEEYLLGRCVQGLSPVNLDPSSLQLLWLGSALQSGFAAKAGFT